jgi:hypothetical protein
LRIHVQLSCFKIDSWDSHILIPKMYDLWISLLGFLFIQVFYSTSTVIVYWVIILLYKWWQHFQNCWQHVSADKLILPKLWHILREGGQGNAVTIFPNILPFLSKILSSVCSNKQDFYDKFFDSIRHGWDYLSCLLMWLFPIHMLNLSPTKHNTMHSRIPIESFS